MTHTKASWIGLGVPWALGVLGVGVAAAWVLSGPAASFKLRGRWESSAHAAAVPPGPPGVFTKGSGQAAENIPGAWTQFLGPKRNALSMDFTVLADSWPAGGPPVVWSADLGPGHAGPIIYDGRVYVLDYQASTDRAVQGDVLRCLSLKDGKEIWRYWYNVPLADDHGISRTVPAIADDYVVTFGPSCHTMCLDALTGDYQWGMSLAGRYETRIPEWYASQCPLIDEGRAIIATGGKKLMIAVALAPEDQGKPTIVWEVDNPLPKPLAVPTFWIPNVILSSDYLISVAPLKVVNGRGSLTVKNLLTLLPSTKYGETPGGWDGLFELGVDRVVTDLYFTLPFDLGIVEARQKLTCWDGSAQANVEECGKIFVGEPYQVDREASEVLGLRTDYLDLIKMAEVGFDA